MDLASEPARAARFPRTLRTPALVLCLAGLAAFGLVTREMLEGDTRRVDTAILVWFRTAGSLAVPRGPVWLTQTAVDLSALGGFTVLWILSLAAIGFLVLERRRGDAVLLAASIGGASLVESGVKVLVGRDRPEVVPHLVQVSTASYPSGHAMLSAAAYLTLAVLLARTHPRPAVRLYLAILAGALVLLIGTSRCYLGVHWPSDVLGGWCLGSAWALGIWMIAQRLGDDRSGDARLRRR